METKHLLYDKKKQFNVNLISNLSNTHDSVTFWKTIHKFRKKTPVRNDIDINAWQVYLNNLFPIRLTPKIKFPIIANELLDKPIYI